MAPRKKVKPSSASALQETQPKTPQEAAGDVDTADAKSSPTMQRLLDPWTTEQETQLFKSMMRWKPTGMHKHFRIICIYNNMRSLGYAPDDAPHTRIPGIWRKLQQLYDLPALDERENRYAFQDDPDPYDPEEAYQLPEFKLPEDEYGELQYLKKFHGPASEAASSPGPIPVEEDKAMYAPGLGLLYDLPEDAKPLRAAMPVTQKTTKTTRASRSAAKSGKGGRAAKSEKAQTESAEEEEDEDEEDEEESSESEEETAPSTRRTNRSSGRKPAPKRTRKR